MLHTQIEHDEVIERYVRDRLTPEERQAFEEHFFACNECFERVQEMERFVAGIRDLAGRGGLDNAAHVAVSETTRWAIWALAAASIAAVALGLMTGWAYLHSIPMLKQELRAALAGTQIEPQAGSRLQGSGNLAQGPEANVPLAMLETSRGQEATIVVLAPGARQLVLWAEIGETRYRSYSMEIDSSSGSRIMTVNGLTRGPYGAIAASLPTQQLQPGIFRITLTGQTPPPVSLVSEYRLQIRKP